MKIWSRLQSWFPWNRRKQRETELERELRDHLDLEAEEQQEAGVSPEEAAYAARRALGNTTLIKEDVRAAWGFQWLETLFQDLRYGLRQLRRNPGFTAVAILTLALGIGANTAIFSVVNAVLLRPLPFRNPSGLITLHEELPKQGFPNMDFSPPDFAVFEHNQRSFSGIGAFRVEHVDISGRGEPERVAAARISWPLFPMLGIGPVLGRTFNAQEGVPGSNVVILSYGLWQHRYGGDSGIVGRTIQINRQPYSIIGVMPGNFEFPLRGLQENNSSAALWVPIAFTPTELKGWGGSYFFGVIGRLRSGVTLNQARSEAGSLSSVLVSRYPAAIAGWVRRGQLTITAARLQDEVIGPVRTLLLVLMSAVGFVLLIACSNISTLLVSRAAARQREIAVRTALGATKLRLARQMLTESIVLGLGGGAIGLIVGIYGRNFLLTLVPPSIPLPRHVPLDGGVLVFALASSILAALFFGMAPAFLVSARSVQGALQKGGRSGAADGFQRVQGFFVTSEFVLALILLVGAGLLIRSFGKLLEARPGFRPDHVLTLNVPLPRQAYSHASQVTSFYATLLQRVSNLPGVQTTGLSSDLPLHGREGVSITVEGRTNGEANTPQAITQSWIVGDYFLTMGIPLLQGRWFAPEDRLGSQPVAIVSLSMARKFWPNESAIGKHIRWGVKAPWQTIIGVVGNVSQGPLSQPLAPHVYRPYMQLPGFFLENDPFSDWHAMNIAVRTRADPVSLTSAVVAQVHSLDGELAVANIQTMTHVIRSSRAGPRFNTILLGGFAGLALVLAAIGVYGVLAYAVARRTHEIGIRMALGAQKRDVLRMVIGQGLKLCLFGVAIGIAGAFAVSRFLSSMLYGVKPTDPLTFVAVSLILIAVALLACYIPARRAAKVDPMVALRYE
jgi:putative ABC transport system permease protein